MSGLVDDERETSLMFHELLNNVPGHQMMETWENTSTDEHGVVCLCGWRAEHKVDPRILFAQHLDIVATLELT